MQYDSSFTPSLISRIHSQSADFVKKRMTVLGLPDLVSSHGFILFCLSKANRLSMGEIAGKINRDKSTTTVLVRKLLKEGLVTFERSESDSRCKYLKLTEQGKKWNAATENMSHELLKTYYAGFSESEKELFFTFLCKIGENLDKSTCN
jgi:MarR family transcriptional regulator, organic hydroperoxide resistance regulator